MSSATDSALSTPPPTETTHLLSITSPSNKFKQSSPAAATDNATINRKSQRSSSENKQSFFSLKRIKKLLKGKNALVVLYSVLLLITSVSK